MEDYFDDLNLTKLISEVSDVKTFEKDNSCFREMNWTISFEVNSIAALKDLLNEEFVITNGEFSGQRFISIFAGNLEEIEIEDGENEDVVYLEINETEVSGRIVFK